MIVIINIDAVLPPPLPGRHGDEVGKKLDLLYAALKAKSLSQKATDHLEAVASGGPPNKFSLDDRLCFFQLFWRVSRTGR